MDRYSTSDMHLGSDSEGTTVYSDNSSSGSSNARICKTCGTKKTPLWRNGPQGPKTLCNACGIKIKKKDKVIDLNEIENENENKNKIGIQTETETDIEKETVVVVKKSGGGKSWTGEGGVEVELSEEDRAALLLMGLSRGSWNQ